jgi:K(+)-stimulated pyrophosphate-energized sodium pump
LTGQTAQTTTAAGGYTWSWMPWAAGGAALFCLIVGALLIKLVARREPGSEKMVELSGEIRKGAFSFIKREYIYVAVFAAAMFVLIAVSLRNQDGWMIALCFLLGAVFALSAGLKGLHISTKANARAAQAATGGFRGALDVAFRSGAVMGLAVVGLGLLGIAICYLIFESWLGIWNSADIILGFALGASTVALFARVGGGLFTESAGVGAATAGLVEGRESDADEGDEALVARGIVGNVGEVAGVGSDLFESYVAATLAPIVIAAMGGVFRAVEGKGMVLPLAIAGAGAICAAIGIWLVGVFAMPSFDYWFRRKDRRPRQAILYATCVTAVLAAAASILLVRFMLGSKYIALLWAPLLGIAAGVIIALSTEYFTSGRFGPVRNLAEASRSGAAISTIKGLALGMGSTVIPVAAVAIAIGVSYYTGHRAIAEGGGLYAIALAALGMLTTTGMVVAANAFRPVADGAQDIAGAVELEEEVRDVTGTLEGAGASIAPIARAFAVGSAVMVALALLAAYAQVANLSALDLLGDWKFLVGILIGAVIPFMFAAIVIGAVSRAAGEAVDEVRSEVKAKAAMGEGGTEEDEGPLPEYEKTIDIAGRSALYEVLLPAAIAVVVPLLVGAFLGKQSLAGFLAGALATGFLLAVTMTNMGGAWDSAKRAIAKALNGDDDPKAVDSASTAGTIGNPLKDAAGPAMNILIKVMAVVSLLFVPLFLK